MRLRDKVAVITGAGHGIGKAYALRFAAEGAAVAIAEIDGAAGEAVAAEIERSGGRAMAVRTDVASEKSTLEMARLVVERFGGIDILVNNAALFASIQITQARFDELPVEEWDRVMAVNAKGPWLCARAVVPSMKQRGGGKIVNIASGHAFSPGPGRIHYAASKAAVVNLTKTLARELGQFHICVNTLAPGATVSEALQPEQRAYQQASVAMRAIRREETPEDLVGALVFLCSSDADFITGQTLIVDGGRVML